MEKCKKIKMIEVAVLMALVVVLGVVLAVVAPVYTIAGYGILIYVATYVLAIMLTLTNIFALKKYHLPVAGKSLIIDAGIVLIGYVVLILLANTGYYIIDKTHSLAILLSDKNKRTFLLFHNEVNVWDILSLIIIAMSILIIITMLVNLNVKEERWIVKNVPLFISIVIFAGVIGYDSYNSLEKMDEEELGYSYSISIDTSYLQKYDLRIGEKSDVKYMEDLTKNADEVSIVYTDGEYNEKKHGVDMDKSEIIEVTDDGDVVAKKEGMAAAGIITYKYNDNNKTCECVYYYFGNYNIKK